MNGYIVTFTDGSEITVFCDNIRWLLDKVPPERLPGIKTIDCLGAALQSTPQVCPKPVFSNPLGLRQ